MTGLFGTDGIRSRFGDEPLVESTVRRLGLAVGEHLSERSSAPLVLLAGDTRASGPLLARWLAQGLTAGGARAADLGVLPTAGVARLVPQRGAAAGVVVSASHNPAEDNGIKLVGADGFKWPSGEEAALERRLDEVADPGASAATPALYPTGRREYADALAAQFEAPTPLAGMRLALDFANGAGCRFAPVFERLGATVDALCDRPDGTNINRDCGATHPERLAERVRGGEFDLGFAFDGDADRAILIDESGAVRDGDAMLYLWASDLAARGLLEPRRVVVTTMSNLGLERALEARGIGAVRCDVGDRAVVETLRREGLRLGGEQSGHLLDLRRSTTGDGLLTALVLADIAARSGAPVSRLLDGFRRYPQVLVNVRVRSMPPFEELPEVAAAAREVTTRLGSEGRLVLRYSGTEPLARIMIEGPDDAAVRALAAELATAIGGAIGAGQPERP